MSAPPSSPQTDIEDLFDSSLYASTIGDRIRRAIELGPLYYLRDYPRYVAARRRIGLSGFDLGALLNPVREFRHSFYREVRLPRSYLGALRRMHAAGLRISMPRVRLEALVSAWWACRDVKGDVLECGAYEGATSVLLALLGRAEALRQRVYCLDTFCGSPAPSRVDGPRHAGEFSPAPNIVSALEGTARQLAIADRLLVVPGLFSTSFDRPALREARFAFVHIDANLYSSTREACAFVMPRLEAGASVVFDDYNGPCDLGARLAIDEALSSDGTSPRPLAWSSAILETAKKVKKEGVPSLAGDRE